MTSKGPKASVVRRRRQRRVYARPPVTDAACEVRFRQTKEWDITLPGRVYEKLRESYPSRPTVTGSDDKSQADGSAGQVVLSSVDGLKQVRFAVNSLSVSVQAPYNGWEEFSPRIKQAANAFVKVVEPDAVEQIQLRYRNLILIPGSKFMFRDYFTIGTTVPEDIPTLFSWFYNGLEASYEDDKTTSLLLTFSSYPSESKDTVGTMLDILVSKKHVYESMTIREMMKIVNSLKARVGDTFEALITDKTRDLFSGG